MSVPELPSKRPDQVPHAPQRPVVRPTDMPTKVDRVVVVPPFSSDTNEPTRRNVRLPGDTQTGPDFSTPPSGAEPVRDRPGVAGGTEEKAATASVPYASGRDLLPVRRAGDFTEGVESGIQKEPTGEPVGEQGTSFVPGSDTPHTIATGSTEREVATQRDSDAQVGALTTSAPERARPYRLRGALESVDSTIEPLPPTPITDEARAYLQNCGVSEQRTNDLRDLTSSGRYDLVLQKAERLVANGGQVDTSDGNEVVVLPEYYNYKDRGDGPCSDLAWQELDGLNTTNLFDDINAELIAQGKRPLRVDLAEGQAPTHFNRGDAKHYWLLIGQEGANDYPLAVDPSFQKISHMGNNGYRIDSIQVVLGQIPTSEPLVLPLGTYTEIEGRPLVELPSKTSTLGLSTDRELTYELSFVKDTHTGVIRPSLVATLAEREEAEQIPQAIIARDGSVRFSGDERLTTGQRDEMRTILTTLSTISLKEKRRTSVEKRRAWGERIKAMFPEFGGDEADLDDVFRNRPF